MPGMNDPELNLPLTGTQEELVLGLMARIPGDRWTPTTSAHVARGFFEIGGEALTQSAPRGGLTSLVGRFAIRKDDVKIFDTVVTALGSTAGAHAFIGNEPTPTVIIGVAVAVFRFLHEVRSKTAALDDGALRIVTILHANVRITTDPGMTADEILTIVRRTSPAADVAWVNQQLRKLEKWPVVSGGTTELVSEVDGRWRPHV
jgi:hypothetical protein